MLKKFIIVFLVIITSVEFINIPALNITLQRKQRGSLKIEHKKQHEIKPQGASSNRPIKNNIVAREALKQLKRTNNTSMLSRYSKRAPNIGVSNRKANRGFDRPYTVLRRSLNITLSKEDFNALARAVQGEALDEPFQGKVAVAAVILNRAKLSGKSVKSVVYAPNQFSCVSGELFNSPTIDSEVIKACLTALSGVDPTYGATHFINKNIASANWTKKLTFTTKIGNHWFYRDEPYRK